MEGDVTAWGEFADRALEREFTRHERTIRLKFIRSILIFGASIFVMYVVMNPLFFDRAMVLAYNESALVVLASLGLYYLATFTKAFLAWKWLDALFYAITALGLALIVAALSGETARTGFTAILLIAVNYSILIVAGSLLFVAATREFIAWLVLVLAGTIGWIVSLDFLPIAKIFAIASLLSFSMFAVCASVEIGTWARRTFVARRNLAAEKAKSEEMLFNVLPRAVTKRIQDGEIVADSFSDVSVIFADVVNFSQLSKRLTARHVVDFLNRFFNAADTLAGRYGIEKVKTVGDGYLAVAGGTASRDSGAREAVAFAEDLLGHMRALAKEEGLDLEMRIGIHSGPVVGGVVGTARLAYDYWGDTVNIASRIESVAERNGLAISAATYFQLKDRARFGRSETVALKGVGEVEIYRLDTAPQSAPIVEP